MFSDHVNGTGERVEGFQHRLDQRVEFSDAAVSGQGPTTLNSRNKTITSLKAGFIKVSRFPW